MIRKGVVIAVLVIFCLTATLFLVKPTGSLTSGQYDSWADVTGPNGVPDGKIDIRDLSYVARLFGTKGTPLQEAAIQFDSGWINITDECGQNIVVTHNLNSTDLIVDIQGRTSLSSGPHQKHYGLTGYTPGWNKTYGGTSLDWACALVQTGDGGYALAGMTESFGAGNRDAWLVKTDASGNMQWSKTYGGTDYDDAWALVQTGDGGYALAGMTESFGAGDVDSWLVKTDDNGTMQWNNTYGGTGGESTGVLVQTVDGGYALAGQTSSFGAGGWDFWLVKTDAAGNAQCTGTYGGTSDDWGVYALVQTSDGGYALAGPTASFGAGGYDFWLVKTDVESGLAWVDSSANTVTLYRGATDVYWNFVRVRLWKPR